MDKYTDKSYVFSRKVILVRKNVYLRVRGMPDRSII